MNNRNKNIYAIAIVLLVLLIVLQVYYKTNANKTINNHINNELYSYYPTPKEAINEGLKIAQYSDRKNEKYYDYNSSVFTLDEDTFYIDFFLSDDNNTMWYFYLEKYNDTGKTMYQTKYYENHIELEKYSLNTIANTPYSYIVVDNEKDLEKYNEVGASINSFNIETVKGEKQLFLVVLYDSGRIGDSTVSN